MGVLVRVDQSLRKRRWIYLWGTLFLFLFKFFRWRWSLVIWKHSSIPKVDFLDLHCICRIRWLSAIDLVFLLVIRVWIWLRRDMRLLRWSKVKDFWLRWRWRQ